MNHLKTVIGENSTAKRLYLEEEVVTRFINGDHKAFESIFHVFYPRIRNFLRGLIKDQDQAEDLTQQVFVDLWINRKRMDSNRNINAYIYTMARNSAFTTIKQQLKFEKNEYDYNLELDNTSTDDDIIAKETQLLIDLTIAAMPAKRKQVYEMSRYENKSNEEIANNMKISRKVVEKHLRLAIRDLQKVVGSMLLFF